MSSRPDSSRRRSVCLLDLGHPVDRLPDRVQHRLGVVEKTVKVHRARVMEKMRAGSVAELVRLADEVGVIVPKS